MNCRCPPTASFIHVPSQTEFSLNELLPLPQSADPVAARGAPVASRVVSVNLRKFDHDGAGSLALLGEVGGLRALRARAPRRL